MNGFALLWNKEKGNYSVRFSNNVNTKTNPANWAILFSRHDNPIRRYMYMSALTDMFDIVYARINNDYDRRIWILR
jgi:hypothetical protein